MKVLSMELGMKCPVACRHCYLSCGPDRTEEMPLEIVRKAIRSFSEIPSAEIVMLTGGEPFAHSKQLRLALNNIADVHKLKSYIITNGYFATSVASAMQTLTSLPPIDFIMVSSDEYHEEFIPLKCVKNTIMACDALGVRAGLSVTLNGGDESYLKKLKIEFGNEFFDRYFCWSTWVHPEGRAAEFGAFKDKFVGLPPKNVCHYAGSPAILPDGTITMCCESTVCSEAPQMPESPFYLGSIEDKNLLSVFLEMDDDLLVQSLRSIGPVRLYELLLENGHKVPLPTITHKLCDVCRAMLNDPKTVTIMSTILQKPEIEEEIRISRFLRYLEVPKSGSRVAITTHNRSKM